MSFGSTTMDSHFASLMNACAVRDGCYRLAENVKSGSGKCLDFHPDRLQTCVDLVVKTCLDNYPDLDIPLHSRWRHFVMQTEPVLDLWHRYTAGFQGDDQSLARSAIDLVFVSVLLDAGAGEDWSYEVPFTGKRLARSEGLAAASLELFFNHLARFDPRKGWIVDARALCDLDETTLAEVFDHRASNPLVGLHGRWKLLHALGEGLMKISPDARPSLVVDLCREKASSEQSESENSIEAGWLLNQVLIHFGHIWPSGYLYQGHNLGDCGHYAPFGDESIESIIPFRKLSQWLTYSLVEPLGLAGVVVTELDQLTGLPEYRNGGLFLDMGVLSTKQPLDPDVELALDSQWVIEWRGMTVYLLDQVAKRVRCHFGKSADELPLCAVLQGGTWAAGRRIAQQLREGGPPPVALAISGTVF